MADAGRRLDPHDLFEPPVDVTPHQQAMRVAEALLFAAAEPLDEAKIASRMPDGVDLAAVLADLVSDYAHRGVQLRRIAGKWMLRTADDLAVLLRDETVEVKKLTRAQIETLAIIAYHQPVTRAEIEEIRGVATSKGILDILLDTGWIRMRGRRRTPGRPVTLGTSEQFLVHFGLDAIRDLPGLDELKGTGLIDVRLPAGFAIPLPTDDPALAPDEDPLDGSEAMDELEPLNDGTAEEFDAEVHEEPAPASEPPAIDRQR
ncbi:MAG: SMC-Scp complex subunit ScpB [Hyphomicrobiales bacterium]|nr:SMC-Scp complex subunit ScpB [Hyphomicrobiales bacterium]OQW83280.1 MAG: SMC-Scp complex subunit ScpB [Proteobacteria bacterium ST_bin15]